MRPAFELFLLCRHLATRYVNIYGHTDSNVFWPGQVLDKLRVFMDPLEPPESAILQSTRTGARRSNFGADNDLRVWPVNDRGYLQQGTIR